MLDVKRLARHTSEKRKRGDTEYIKIDPTNAEDLKRLPKDMVDEQRPFREGDLIGVCSCGFVSWHLKGPGSFKTAKYKALNMHANAEIPEVCTSVEMAEAEDECTSKEPERYELVEYNEMKRKYVELEKEKEMVEQKLAKTEELCRVQGQVLFGIYRFLINRLPSIWFPDDVKQWFGSRDRNLYFDPFLHNVIGSRTTLDGLTFLTCLFKLPRVPELHASVQDSLDVLSDPIPIRREKLEKNPVYHAKLNDSYPPWPSMEVLNVSSEESMRAYLDNVNRAEPVELMEILSHRSDYDDFGKQAILYQCVFQHPVSKEKTIRGTKMEFAQPLLEIDPQHKSVLDAYLAKHNPSTRWWYANRRPPNRECRLRACFVSRAGYRRSM